MKNHTLLIIAALLTLASTTAVADEVKPIPVLFLIV